MTDISISVRVYGDLRKYLDRGAPEEQAVSLPAGATVGDLLRFLRLPPEEQVTPGVNGEMAPRDAVLRAGDQVLLFGPMEGG